MFGLALVQIEKKLGMLRAWVLLRLLIILFAFFWGCSSQSFAQTATVTATNNQSCAGTRFGGDLNCTANDLTSTLTFTQPAATAISSCVVGQFVFVDVIGTITSGSASRYDIGYFFGENGINPELNNPLSSCSIGLFPTTPTPFYSADSDTCGEILSSGAATMRINSVKLLCQPKPGTTTLGLPYVLSFSNSINGSTCNVGNLVPNTTSKCVSSAQASGLLNGVGVIDGITANGYITVTKQTLPDTQTGSFTFSATASPAATVTPSSVSLSDNGSQLFQVPLVAGGTRILTITEAALGGWDPTTSISCTNPATGGSASTYVTVNNATRTITANLTAADYGALCTVTNTKIPTVKVQKITRGDVGGAFTFTKTNLASNPVNISTTTALLATPASPSFIEVSTISTAVTITEAMPSAFVLNAASCTDANSVRTGNTGSIGTVSGSTLTIPAARVTAGSDYTCVFTNDKRPTLQVRALSNGGLATFGFTGTNGYGSDSIATTTIGAAASGTINMLTLPATSTAITASTIPTGYALASASCTSMGSGGTATLSGSVLTLDTAATAAGANPICTFTYNKIPTVKLQKTTTGNFGGPFAFTATNLVSGFSNISTTVAATPTPTVPSAINVSTIGTAVTITETTPLPSTYIITGASCTDANSAVTGNTGSFGTLSSYTLTVAAARVVAGANITCVITNLFPLPALSVAKSANVASVNVAGASITYTILVSNTGNVPLTSIVVTDALGTVTCPTSGTATIAALAVSGVESCTMTYVVPQSVLNNNGGGDGDIDNTAAANGSYGSVAVNASNSATVILVISPSLRIIKTANNVAAVGAGTSYTYSFKVKNMGNVAISGVTISETFNGFGTAPTPGSEAMFADAAPASDSTDAAANGSWDVLAPGDEIIFTANYNVVQADIDFRQ